MRNALNLRFCFLVTFLLFIPLMYALPPEGITIKGRVTDETLKEGVPGANVTVKGTALGQSQTLTVTLRSSPQAKNPY